MRIPFVRALLIFFLFLILVRLFYWQVIQKDDLTVRAEQQHFENREVLAKRGNILFSDGSTLVSNQPIFLLYAEPKVISNEEKQKIAKKLNDFFQDKTDYLEPMLRNLFWVPLKKNNDIETKKKIEELKLPGVGFEQTYTRFYPEGSSSAALLGFVGSDSKGDPTGYFGLEGAYNGELRGVGGSITQEKDALGIPLLIGRFLGSGGQDGNNLELHLDRVVQFITEKSLKKGIEKYGARSGSVVIMDPKTGAIIAMASYPNYDPAKYDLFPKENYRNSVVADSYEPGSTFKVLTMASAINEDLVKPDTICDICAGPVEIGGFSIRTWNNKYYENSTIKEVIVHSDNTGMVYVAKKLGVDKFYSYIENFGMGNLTNIDLQDESSPDLRPMSAWREIDLATASFGQGIAVTPIQMVRAVSAIANGGKLMEPHLVKNISGEGQSHEIKPKVVREVISEATSKIVTEMMVAAVEEGEAKVFVPKGFKIAGKTGTAQIPVAGHYDPTKTIASFVGFAPAHDPKFVMLVVYNQPSSSIFGSETAAPTFFEIAKQLFPYYKIAPTE